MQMSVFDCQQKRLGSSSPGYSPTLADTQRINGKGLLFQVDRPGAFGGDKESSPEYPGRQDVTQLWSCDPKSIKILGIDLGQAFVVGASAILPTREQLNVEQGQEFGITTMASLLSSVEAEEDEEALRLLFDAGAYKCL
ncbi:hypothetical protein KI688_001476 [Linnemannia hyalina]|uniref:Uncharacterized protein n=1 Tax=Linnemannia hyalina TaxID=64524 RepID=A0A9P7XRW1_9FUNG|nr:hypothetical protein KI688_001476 [Linnemannia hyalina]